MYQIQLQDIRDDLALQLATAPWDYEAKFILGGSQDSATAFAIAADADALASRLMDCADARLSAARNAVWGDNPDALFFNPPAALNQSARALLLVEKAGEAKMFSERMLECAVVFERAAAESAIPLEDGPSPDYDNAQATWNFLMCEGIFGREMYELPPLTADF